MTVVERTGTVSHFIGGEAVDVGLRADLRHRSIHRPGEEIAQVAFGEAEDVDRAVAAGRAAFESGAWSKASPGHRATVMRRLADLIRQDADRIGAIESRDTGKPLGQATGEVDARRRLPDLLRRPRRAAQRHAPTRPTPATSSTRSASRTASSARSARGTTRSCSPAGRRRRRSRSATPSCSRWPSRRRCRPRELGRLTLEAGHAGRRLQRRPRRRPDDRRRARRPSARPEADVHRLDRDRPGDPALGRGPHQERPPRARRQDAEHRLRRRGPRPGHRGLAVHGLLQHRPDLHERLAPPRPAQARPTRSSTRSWSAPGGIKVGDPADGDLAARAAHQRGAVPARHRLHRGGPARRRAAGARWRAAVGAGRRRLLRRADDLRRRHARTCGSPRRRSSGRSCRS